MVILGSSLTFKSMDSIIKTKNWLDNVVIDLVLCPFARQVYIENQILYIEHVFTDLLKLFTAFDEAYLTICNVDNKYSTALLIVNSGLDNFEDYLDVFYTLEDKLIEDKNDENIQLASFHPQYQFEGTNSSEASNYTNRSPYPIIHLLQTDLVEKAIDSYPNIDAVPVENIKKMEELGLDGIERLFEL